MIRGTVNEALVFKTLCKKPFFVAIFDVGMIFSGTTPWISCFPNAIGVIDLSIINIPNLEENVQHIATVDNKTKVTSISIQSSLNNRRSEPAV